MTEPLPTTEDKTCTRWWSVPWYDCQAEGFWRVFPFECEVHDECPGHLFCPDHLVSPVLSDPAYRDGVRRIVRALPRIVNNPSIPADGTDDRICGAESLSDPGYHCDLHYGHDGPHFASIDGYIKWHSRERAGATDD